MGEGAAPIAVPEEPKASNKWGVIIAIVTVLGTITVALINRPHSKVETVKQISVDGRITDENGPVSNAQVTLEQTGTGTVQATSHSDGDFHFDRVSTTPFTLSVQAGGHALYSENVNPAGDVFRFLPVMLHATGGSFNGTQPNQTAEHVERVKLVEEFDNRVAEVESVQRQLADPSKTHDERVSLSVLVWRVWYGDHEYKATAPEFANTRWIAVVSQLKVNGVVKGSQQAEDAIRQIEQGNPQQVYDANFLQTQLNVLKNYSSMVLHPSVGE